MLRPRSVRRASAILLTVGVLLLATTGIVSAHAELEDPTPNRDAEVEGSPPEISGIYSQAMDPEGSSLRLENADGDIVARGGVDPDDDLRMAIDPVPELPPGDYLVRSTTASAADGDIDRTTWRFTVLAVVTPEPTASPTPTPSASPPPTASAVATTSATPTASPSAVASPTPSPSGGGSDTGSSGDALLPILAAVAILAILGGVLYSRRDRSTTTPP